VHWRDSGLTDRLRLERFRPRLLTDAGEGGEVVFARSATTVEAPGGTALLDAGEAAGVLMPSGCRMGICHGCVVPLLAGRVRDLRTGDVHGEEGDLVQTCISAAAGPVELDL
jgi:ferredoxin